MLKLRTKHEENLIVTNVIEAATKSIENLNKSGYAFLYIASGFIAHYDRFGFIAHYGNARSLGDDILGNQPNNQWNNFRPGERDYEYMMQKKNIYNRICNGIQLYRETHKDDPMPYTITLQIKAMLENDIAAKELAASIDFNHALLKEAKYETFLKRGW